MVPIMRLFRNLPALFALVCATTGQGADPIYRKVGDSVVLNPGQPFNAISSATWKHNTDLASEWFGTGNVDCYRDFKGRCSLNKKDGSFTISNLKVEDSGSYTPEINDKVLNQLELQVIKPVPKPTVSVKCNYEKTLCNLTCEANINPDVGTVKYEWRTGEVVLSNNKELIITENKESSFICMLKNPVSSSSSDGVDNPLSRGNPGAEAGLAVIIVVLIVAVVLAVVGRILYYKRKNGKRPTFKEFWCCNIKKTKGQYAPVSTQERNISGSNEEDEQFHLAFDTVTRDPTGQYTPVPEQDTITKKNHEPNGGGPADTVQIVNENEDKTSPGDNKKADDPDQKPALNSFSKNQGDSRTVEQPFIGSETNISVSSEEDEQFHPASDTVTSCPTEDKSLPIDDRKTPDQLKMSAFIPSNENHGKQHQVFSPEETTSKPSENNRDGDKQQGNQPLTEDTNKTTKDENNQDVEDKQGNQPLTGDTNNTNNDENNQDGDKQQGNQPLTEDTNKTTKDEINQDVEDTQGNQPLTGDTNNTTKDEDKTPSSNDKNRDDLHQKPAEDSSIVKLGDSNPEGKSFKGSENTSETPSGPETSEQVSADQDQS